MNWTGVLPPNEIPRVNHKIIETLVTSQNADGTAHIAPMGIWQTAQHFVLAPFKPSQTLVNVLHSGVVVLNFTDQVTIFAGCLSGRYDWPVISANKIECPVLQAALTHIELELSHVVEDEIRPELHCNVVHEQMHAGFNGFNRAQAAVIELAILTSRLDRLPTEKIQSEYDYLKIAVDKTAGADERKAWGWLAAKVEQAGIKI